jgi:hypothetical protein
MYPRTNYEMTEEDLTAILEASKPTIAIWGSGGAPFGGTPQENANAAWKSLGNKMGFIWDSCQPIPGKGSRFFSAIPSETAEAKAERESREKEEALKARIATLESEIKERREQLTAILNR